MKEAFAKAAESVKHLAHVYGDGWLRDLEVYQSIDDYLQKVIAQKPKEKVFEESFGFEDVYVPLQVKPVDKDSRVKDKEEAKNIEEWAVELLQDSSKKRQVLFIQGGPGRGKTYTVSTEQLNWEIYDLLGFGRLTPEIVEYLMALLKQSDVDWEVLFERLEGFYLDWCRGEFIEALDSAAENLPLKKVRQLQKYGIDVIGQRTVDIYAGFNVLILLFELHRYAQTQDELKDKISFHPCGQPDTDEFHRERLLRIIKTIKTVGDLPGD